MVTTKSQRELQKQERLAEEAAAQKTLQLEKERAEKETREAEKKRRAAERKQQEEEDKRLAEAERIRKETWQAAKAKAKEDRLRVEREAAELRAQEEKREAEDAAKLASIRAERAEGAGDAMEVVNEGINDLINDINKGGGEDNEGDTNMEGGEESAADKKGDAEAIEVDSDDGGSGDEIRSPKKKKSKSSKKEKKEKKKKDKKDKEKAKESTSGTASILKQPRFSGVGTKPSAARVGHKHKYKRVLVEASIILRAPGNAPEKMVEFTNAIKSLMSNCQLLDDKFQIETHDTLCMRDPYYSPADVQSNLSVQSFHIRTTGGSQSFEMQKPTKNQKKEQQRRRKAHDDDEDEDFDMIDPQVWFSFAFSTDMVPKDLLDRVSCEWGKAGGQRFYIKVFSTFDTENAVMAIKTHTRTGFPTLLAEFQRMFQEAKQYIKDNTEGEWYEFDSPIPQVSTRLNVPKIQGQDTSVFNGWSNKQQFRRKMVHFEFESKHVPHVHEVVTAMKESGILKKYWGREAHLSNITRNDAGQPVYSAGETKNLCKLARSHVNYIASMVEDCLEGVTDLDREFTFYSASDRSKPAGRMSLRHILYHYVTLKDGEHALFVEIHQESMASAVEVIIPNTPEATGMLEQINKNLAAFLYFSLQDRGIDRTFITDVLKGSVDALMCQEIGRCTYDKETGKLSTPRDAEEERKKSLESQAWYKDEFGSHMESKSKKMPREFANEEMMYEHGGDKSVVSVHERPGKYEGSPGAPNIQLGRPDVVEQQQVDDDDISVLSTWDRERLLEEVKKLKLAKSKGSQPKHNSKKSAGKPASRDEDDASSSSGSESDSSSDSSKAATSTSSADGSDSRSQSATGE